MPWEEWREAVLERLDRNEKALLSMDSKWDSRDDAYNRRLTNIEVQIAMLQVKAGVWGFIGGAVICITSIGVAMIAHMVGH